MIVVFHQVLLGAITAAVLHAVHWLLTGDLMASGVVVMTSAILSLGVDVLLQGRALREARRLSALYDLPPHQR